MYVCVQGITYYSIFVTRMMFLPFFILLHRWLIRVFHASGRFEFVRSTIRTLIGVRWMRGLFARVLSYATGFSVWLAVSYACFQMIPNVTPPKVHTHIRALCSYGLSVICVHMRGVYVLVMLV